MAAFFSRYRKLPIISGADWPSYIRVNASNVHSVKIDVTEFFECKLSDVIFVEFRSSMISVAHFSEDVLILENYKLCSISCAVFISIDIVFNTSF